MSNGKCMEHIFRHIIHPCIHNTKWWPKYELSIGFEHVYYEQLTKKLKKKSGFIFRRLG